MAATENSSSAQQEKASKQLNNKNYKKTKNYRAVKEKQKIFVLWKGVWCLISDSFDCLIPNMLCCTTHGIKIVIEATVQLQQ